MASSSSSCNCASSNKFRLSNEVESTSYTDTDMSETLPALYGDRKTFDRAKSMKSQSAVCLRLSSRRRWSSRRLKNVSKYETMPSFIAPTTGAQSVGSCVAGFQVKCAHRSRLPVLKSARSFSMMPVLDWKRFFAVAGFSGGETRMMSHSSSSRRDNEALHSTMCFLTDILYTSTSYESSLVTTQCCLEGPVGLTSQLTKYRCNRGLSKRGECRCAFG